MWGGPPARLDVKAPVGAQAPQSIIDPPASRNQLRLGAAGQVRSPKGNSLLKGAVLVDDQAFAQEESPRQQIGQDRGATLVFADAAPLE